MPTQNTASDLDIELRSEEVQEILTYIPHWVVRWGITVIGLSLCLLLIMSWVIKYPDMIPARITLTSPNPALRVVARREGNLILLVADKKFVKKGTYLGQIENPTNLDDASTLRDILTQFQSVFGTPDKWLDLKLADSPALGSMQLAYSNFQQSIRDYAFFAENQFHQKKIDSLAQQIAGFKELTTKLTRQLEVLSQELASAKKIYDANKELYDRKMISKKALVGVENSFLKVEHSKIEEEKKLIHNKISIGELENKISELRQDFRKEERGLIQRAHEAYEALHTQLLTWEQDFVLKAPVGGYVSLFQFWSDNQYVTAGQEVMSIVPESKGIVGRLLLTERGAGKVKKGQKVRIKMDSYPFEEFGYLEGEVATISQVPRQSSYMVGIHLPNDLTTNYDKTLPFRDGMQGNADVVTEDLRILQRLLHNFRKLFSASKDVPQQPQN